MSEREATPRPWYYDGRDIFAVGIKEDGHRLVIPLPDTFHPSQEVSKADAELVVLAVNSHDALMRLLETVEDSISAHHDVTIPVKEAYDEACKVLGRRPPWAL